MVCPDNTTVNLSTSIDHEGDQMLDWTVTGTVDGDDDIENWRQGVTSDDCGDSLTGCPRVIGHSFTR